MNWEEKRDQEHKEDYLKMIIRKMGFHTCKDFETFIGDGEEIHLGDELVTFLEEDAPRIRNASFADGIYNAEFDLIKSEHGWEFSADYEFRINGEWQGIISVNTLRELLQDRYL